jgi:hypothetical protein
MRSPCCLCMYRACVSPLSAFDYSTECSTGTALGLSSGGCRLESRKRHWLLRSFSQHLKTNSGVVEVLYISVILCIRQCFIVVSIYTICGTDIPYVFVSPINIKIYLHTKENFSLVKDWIFLCDNFITYRRAI